MKVRSQAIQGLYVSSQHQGRYSRYQIKGIGFPPLLAAQPLFNFIWYASLSQNGLQCPSSSSRCTVMETRPCRLRHMSRRLDKHSEAQIRANRLPL